ncbi:MAG: MFS transporter [Oscillospiraceae bacterium]|nr:MFS transporter [Oscillospiraceae bacterium]
MAINEKSEKTGEIAYTRRYVGFHETVAYLFNDVSNSFNIGGYEDRYKWDVVGIDFKIAATVNVFTGAWDIINDSIIGVMVDKTRTRWGKFRPYILGLQIPITLVAVLYWFIPIFFPGTATTYVPKLAFWFSLGVVKETANTFRDVARGGYMSTITPNPDERGRLIMLAELLSGNMGEDLPNVLMGVLIDLINNRVVPWKLGNLFIIMGSVTSVLSAAMSFWFTLIARERVMQRVERPSIKEGIRAVINNKPMLLIMLSELLGDFKISVGRGNYFIDVLGMASLDTIVNLPSSFNGTISYAFVQPLRRRFSSKALWVFEDVYTRSLTILLFLFGMVNHNYSNRMIMSVLFGTHAFFDKFMFGIRKVIGVELQNEALDYCEWKNGYRAEATISVAKGLVKKIQRVAMDSVYQLVMDRIGYRQQQAFGSQTANTKRWLFAMCTGVPAITSVLGVVPKFFYPLSKEIRTRMYNELYERRGIEAAAVNEGSGFMD